MKIGIVTLPLHFNYGGILQAYALQETLKRLGHTPFILRTPIKSIKNHLKIFLYSLSGVSDFVNKYIRFDNLNEPLAMSELTSNKYNALIVGSDQVWRSWPGTEVDRKTNIRKYFLRTIGNGDLRKIAYAASFGVDYLDFTEEEETLAKGLVKDFVAVSVREESGIALCTKYLGRTDACMVLDPTLLLTEDDYLHFVVDSPFKSKNKHCFVYLLDYKEIKNQKTVKELLPMNSEVLAAKVERNTLKRYLNSRLTIQDWLSAIYYSDMVITDSFHGCVFSILFHKDFYVMENDVGGNTRINSLLSIFSLEDRLIRKGTNYNRYTIDWKFVEKKLQSMRNFSIDYLSRALA